MKPLVAFSAVAAAWALSAASASAQELCASDDLNCRVGALENRVIRVEERLDQVIRYLQAQQGAGVGGRTVDVPTDVSCSGDSCIQRAAELCRQAGFSRGVPKAFRDDYGFTKMIQITCMD